MFGPLFATHRTTPRSRFDRPRRIELRKPGSQAITELLLLLAVVAVLDPDRDVRHHAGFALDGTARDRAVEDNARPNVLATSAMRFLMGSNFKLTTFLTNMSDSN